LRDIWHKIIHTSSAKLYNALLVALTVAVTARILGPEGRGELVAINTWVTTFSTFAYLSLGQVAVHRAAQSKEQTWFTESYRTLIYYAVIMSLVAWTVALIMFLSPMRTSFGNVTPLLLAIGFLAIPLQIWILYSSSLLQAIERLDINNRYLVIGGTAGITSIICFLYFLDFGLAGVLIGNLISLAITAAGGFVLLNKKAGGWALPKRATMQVFLRDGFKLHMNAIGNFFLIGSDILILNYFRGSSETAYYQLGAQLITMIMLFPQAASMVITGRISSLGPNNAWLVHKKILIQVTLFILAFGMALGMTCEIWIPLIFGELFMPSVSLFQWLLVASIGMTFSTLMAPQWIGRGMFKTVSGIAIVIGGVNLLLNLFLIPSYGVMGAIISTLIAFSLSALTNGLMFIYCNRQSLLNQSRLH